jgi:CRISPR-associated protein Cmr2
MSQKYLALTIGPMDNTFAKARHTRELWAASYTFSYLMKKICEAIPNKKDILVPAVEGALDELFDCKDSGLYNTGAGLFPDRLILKADTLSFKDLNEKIETVLSDFAKEVAQKLNRKDKEKIVENFKKYFQLYTLEVETEGNIVKTIMPYLDSLELQRNYSLKDDKTLSTFFYRVSESFLVQDAFKKSKKRFTSLVEIATKHFENDINDISFPEMPEADIVEEDEGGDSSTVKKSNKDGWEKYSNDLDKRIAELEKSFNPTKPETTKPFLPCYKYVAVVQADGDKVGTIVTNLATTSNEALLEFSKKLYQFSKEAVKKIDAYGGMNIYAGGDDLLFFAPVRCGDKTIFDLLDSIDSLLKEKLIDYSANEPSMSFGVAISYFKAPLYETLKGAAHQLFAVAKQPSDKPKNALAFQIRKHSGHEFSTKIKLTSESFKKLQELLALKDKDGVVDLRGLAHNLIKKKTEIIATKGIPERIENFMNNNMDEFIHKNEGKVFLEKIRELLNASIEETRAETELENNNDILKLAIEKVNVMLNIYLFLTSNELK